MLIGYARVSTEDQNLDLQRNALRKAGCKKIFEEKESGRAGTKRPAFEAALAYLRPQGRRMKWAGGFDGVTGCYGSPFVNEGRTAMSVEKLVEHFSALEDPRCSGKVDHRLIDILVIAVCAVIACAESWDDIALYGRNKLSWLRSFLSLANGIPSHDTFRRVFMLIDPDAFEACFSAWAQSFAEAFDREVVAIDGKTLRRSFDRGRAQGPLHLVSAWASEQGLALGQREVDGKSNEITAIPALLETLSLKNCIVTLDAMGCQKTIANQILERGADYLLVLKANHGKAFLAVKECCERHCFARGATARPVFDAVDDSHGRLARRRVFACPEAASLEALRAWPGLRTVLAVETIRGVNGSGHGRSGDPLWPVQLRR